MIVVSGDPLADISVLHDHDNIQLVLKEGVVEYTSESCRLRSTFVVRDSQERGRPDAWGPTALARFEAMSARKG